MNNIEKIIEEYIEAAIQHGISTEDGDYKLANKQYRVIEKSIDKLKSIEGGIDKLEKLLNHESDYVKLWSSRYLLTTKEYTAIQTLKELINRPGFLGLTAKITLDEWFKGNIH